MGLQVALVDLIQKLAALAAGRVDAPLRVDGNELHNAPFAAFQHLGKGRLLGAEPELAGKVDADARKQSAALRLQGAGDLPALAAHESGLDRDFISNIHKNSPDVLRGLYLSSHAVRRAMLAQDKIIRKIAEEGSCVIVGRAADHVLRDFPNVVRVFIGAPEEFRISRVREVYGDTLQEAKRNLRHSDKARAGYYRHLSGKRWGNPQNYDLVLDSSEGLDTAAETLAAFVKEKEAALKDHEDGNSN